jgi:hypothetical protein
MREWLDPPFIAPSDGGMLLVRLVIVRAMIIIIPLITSFALDVISFLASVFNLVMRISVANYITQEPFVPISAVLNRRCYAAGRVPARALAVARVLTLPPVSLIKGRVNHYSHVQHCMEVLDLRIYFLTVFRQQGCELVDDHPGNQGIVCRRAVNLLALKLDLAEFITNRLRTVLEFSLGNLTLKQYHP